MLERDQKESRPEQPCLSHRNQKFHRAIRIIRAKPRPDLPPIPPHGFPADSSWVVIGAEPER